MRDQTEPKPLLGRAPLRIPHSPWAEAAGRVLARQAAIESFGAPGYGLTLAYPRTDGFAASPRDFRPADTVQGRALLGGRFAYAGAVLEARRPGDPFNRPSPSRAFAVELHRFSWLPHLTALGEPGLREGLRLVLAWGEAFGAWTPFAWGREVLSRRVYNLACAGRKLAGVAGEAEAVRVADLLARQTRHLLRLPDDRAWATEHNAAALIAGAALDGKAGDELGSRALPRLKKALGAAVLPDGCHASRSPEAALDSLLDLLTVDDALVQRGEPAPVELTRAVDRLTQAVRFFTLGDGRLPCFQGGEACAPSVIAAACAHDEESAGTPVSLEDGRYHRLQGRLLQACVDAGAPARGPYAVTACAQPLALEIVCGEDRLVTNAAWSPREPERQGFRLTAAGSTVTLGETSVLEPLSGKLAETLGPRLEGPPLRVASRRREAEGAAWVELAHDGWAPRFGLIHERRLFVDARTDELRGEDRLAPARGARPRVLAAPYAVRFHLHPEVQVSLARDRKSVLLRGPSGRGWWFRDDAAEVSVEPSMWFEAGVPRRSAQIVLKGVARTDAMTRVRWKLAPADGPGGEGRTPKGR